VGHFSAGRLLRAGEEEDHLEKASNEYINKGSGGSTQVLKDEISFGYVLACGLAMYLAYGGLFVLLLSSNFHQTFVSQSG
jgi:hypothetical protein